MSSVRPCHNTQNFCKFCNTFIPVPETSGSSVRLPYPDPEVTNPTEHKYTYDHSFFWGFGQEFFFVSASVCDSRNWNSRSNIFVRALSSGGGSNAPRPAVSVPHLDVNAGGCRARQAESCKRIACRGGIPEILVVSSRLQRLDDLQNWHYFQKVVANVLNFAVAYSRAFVLLDVCRA